MTRIRKMSGNCTCRLKNSSSTSEILAVAAMSSYGMSTCWHAVASGSSAAVRHVVIASRDGQLGSLDSGA
eukprot:15434656-Alexandrium_andersonii.AAC.1